MDKYFDLNKINNELKGNWEVKESLDWEKFHEVIELD